MKKCSKPTDFPDNQIKPIITPLSLSSKISRIIQKYAKKVKNFINNAHGVLCIYLTLPGLTSFRFEKVGPGGELKHGAIDEQTYTQKAETHGIMFALTRQMIIDDDLGALTDIPRQIGIGAAEAIADAVWTLLLSNPLQPDGKTFFHACCFTAVVASAPLLQIRSRWPLRSWCHTTMIRQRQISGTTFNEIIYRKIERATLTERTQLRGSAQWVQRHAGGTFPHRAVVLVPHFPFSINIARSVSDGSGGVELRLGKYFVRA